MPATSLCKCGKQLHHVGRCPRPGSPRSRYRSDSPVSRQPVPAPRAAPGAKPASSPTSAAPAKAKPPAPGGDVLALIERHRAPLAERRAALQQTVRGLEAELDQVDAELEPIDRALEMLRSELAPRPKPTAAKAKPAAAHPVAPKPAAVEPDDDEDEPAILNLGAEELLALKAVKSLNGAGGRGVTLPDITAAAAKLGFDQGGARLDRLLRSLTRKKRLTSPESGVYALAAEGR